MDTKERFRFAEAWFRRRLLDHARNAAGMTDRELWTQIGDDTLQVLAYRARVTVRAKQEAYRDLTGGVKE